MAFVTPVVEHWLERKINTKNNWKDMLSFDLDFDLEKQGVHS